MTRRLPASWVLTALGLLVPAAGQASNGSIAFYSDPEGTVPVTSVIATAFPGAYVYVFLELAGPALTNGIAAFDGDLRCTTPSGGFVSGYLYNPDGSLSSSSLALNQELLVSYKQASSPAPECVTNTTGFPPGRVRFARAQVFGTGQEVYFWAEEISDGNAYACAGGSGTPVVVLCDAPVIGNAVAATEKPALPMLSIGNTADGTNVVVRPRPDVNATVAFAQVTVQGQTSLEAVSPCTAAAPANYTIVPASAPVCYDMRTNAQVSGQMEVCLPYDDSGLTPDQEARLQILQCDGSGQNCVPLTTTGLNTATNRGLSCRFSGSTAGDRRCGTG